MKRVLVVDDEESIRAIVAEALEDEGSAVATARNGAEALIQVRASAPHGIVLDLMMPVLDGWVSSKRVARTSSAPGFRYS
jgi:CheY-like chemotaxis protein